LLKCLRRLLKCLRLLLERRLDLVSRGAAR
jgi:DNA-binding winged helix-turn-helix (wHTH) protein